jgi:hypothetical protein
MFRLALSCLLGVALATSAKIQVPTEAPEKDTPKPFHDSKHGVRFMVPPGWILSKKDHEVSTFRLDTPNTTSRNEMRAVASIGFNPFPRSTLSGALVYYSVQKHATDDECQRQATVSEKTVARPDVQSIGGMNFIHDHRETGAMCLESRDDVYVAFHKKACYRFDVVVNFFCSQVSGADDITLKQMNSIESRASDILSSISFDWDKGGATTVPPPTIKPDEPFLPAPPKKHSVSSKAL